MLMILVSHWLDHAVALLSFIISFRLIIEAFNHLKLGSLSSCSRCIMKNRGPILCSHHLHPSIYGKCKLSQKQADIYLQYSKNLKCQCNWDLIGMKCLTAEIEGLLSSPGDGWDTSIPKMIVEGPKLLVICGLKGELKPPICETNRVSTMSFWGLCNYIINIWALAQMLTSKQRTVYSF